MRGLIRLQPCLKMFPTLSLEKSELEQNTLFEGCQPPPTLPLKLATSHETLATKEILKSGDSLCHVIRHQGGYHTKIYTTKGTTNTHRRMKNVKMSGMTIK